MIIARGTEAHPIRSIGEGARHTLFQPAQSRAQARKRWIMGSLAVSGSLTLDAGAVKALLTGKSLLPVGVTEVTGTFERGDAVSILDPDGREIARGLVGLDDEEARLVKGKKGPAVQEMLGLGTRAELVHRDNLVLLAGQAQEV
jgi:Glutamate 5-kinase